MPATAIQSATATQSKPKSRNRKVEQDSGPQAAASSSAEEIDLIGPLGKFERDINGKPLNGKPLNGTPPNGKSLNGKATKHSGAKGEDPGKFEMIPLDQIAPPLHNPRKTFDKAEMDELAASVRVSGVIQPILLRPIAHGDENPEVPGKRFEIVAGERRFRASQMAEKSHIPAILRELTPEQTVEFRQIENLQRVNLDPIEEANGFKQLIDECDYTAETLAAKLGKGKSYIYASLKLCGLPAAAVNALRDGSISKSHAELIARIPCEEMRPEALGIAVNGLVDELWDGPQPSSVKQLQEWITEHCAVQLKGAPFKTDRASTSTLAILNSPPIGSCTDCPKMTGNNPDLFPGARADVCTEPKCFRSKVEAHANDQLAKHEAKGIKIATTVQTKEIFRYSSDHATGYVRLDEKPYQDKKGRNYKQLLEGHADPIAAIAPSGQVVLLVPESTARKICTKVHKINFGSNDGRPKPTKQEKEQKQIRKQAANLIIHRAADRAGVGGNKNEPAASAIAILAAASLGFAAAQVICQDLGLKGAEPEEELQAYIATLEESQCLGFAVRCLLSEKFEGWINGYRKEHGEAVVTSLALLGVDAAAADEDAKAEVTQNRERVNAIVEGKGKGTARRNTKNEVGA